MLRPRGTSPLRRGPAAGDGPRARRPRHRQPGADADANHNGYLLRWDGEGFLFDPGEGTQRQMLLAGVPSSAVTQICLTHFHGHHWY